MAGLRAAGVGRSKELRHDGLHGRHMGLGFRV